MASIEMVSPSRLIGKQILTGIGNTCLSIEMNRAGAEGSDYRASIVSYMQTTMANDSVGNHAVAVSVIERVSFYWPGDFMLLYAPR